MNNGYDLADDIGQTKHQIQTKCRTEYPFEKVELQRKYREKHRQISKSAKAVNSRNTKETYANMKKVIKPGSHPGTTKPCR